MKRRCFAIVWLLAVIALVAGCSLFIPRLTPARTELAAPRVEVPIRMVAAIPLVEARVGGGAPRWFIVDSGGAACVISSRVAAELRLGDAGTTSASDGTHGGVVKSGRVARIDVGGARFDDVFAIVLDLTDIEARFGVELGGVLGFPLFSDLTWTLDYAQSRLVLERTSLPPPNGADVLAMEIDGERHPTIKIGLAGRDEDFVIDTGSDSVFDVPRETSARLALRAAPVEFPAARMAFGASPHRAARLAGRATIGRFRFDDPMLSLMATDRQAIGGRALAGFAITFDSRRGAVRLTRAGEPVVQMPPKRTLGARVEKRAGVWRVVERIPVAGAAPTPLAPGDEVVSIDGHPAAPLDEEAWVQRIQNQDAIELEVSRAGQPLRLTAPVATMVR